MQRKTIKKSLNRKLSDWIESITDESVANAVRNDVIVTGGSIASMLLGEKVNDYDLYFRTPETAEAVAKYYVERFKSLRPGHGGITVEVGEKVNAKGETEKRVSVHVPSAGVAGDNDDAEDGCEDPPETQECDPESPYQPVFLSENAITLTGKIQIIVRFFGEPEEIHNNYDFAHAKNWYSLKGDTLHLDPLALECLLSRVLIYQGSLYPICSIFRARKFIARGWRISAGELLKIMWQVSELDLTDTNVLRDQLTGVDALYFSHLVDQLADLDKEKLTSNYVSEIIDRIFQGE